MARGSETEGGGEAVGVGDAAFGFEAGGDLGGFPIDVDEFDTEAADDRDSTIGRFGTTARRDGVPDLACIDDRH